MNTTRRKTLSTGYHCSAGFRTILSAAFPEVAGTCSQRSLGSGSDGLSLEVRGWTSDGGRRRMENVRGATAREVLQVRQLFVVHSCSLPPTPGARLHMFHLCYAGCLPPVLFGCMFHRAPCLPFPFSRLLHVELLVAFFRAHRYSHKSPSHSQ